jgi:hypothetical protein
MNMARPEIPRLPESCPWCRGWVYHRTEPCNCQKDVKKQDPYLHDSYLGQMAAVLDVVRKADRLDAVVAEFGMESHVALGEFMEELSKALERLPGTSAYNMMMQRNPSAADPTSVSPVTGKVK